MISFASAARRSRILALVGLAAGALVLSGCSAGGAGDATLPSGSPSEGIDYPTGNIEVVVPFGAGGGTDTDARAVVAAMDAATDANIVVTNIAGGGGTLGLTEALKRPADGNTIALVFPSIHAMGQEIAGADYDLESVEYIGGFRESYNMIAVAASTGITTLDELFAYGQEQGRLIVVSGPASVFLVTAQQLVDNAGVPMESLGYEGVPQAFAGLEAGDGDFWMGGDGAAAGLGDAANVLAYAAPERSPLLPDVPTLAELGYGDVYMDPISAGFVVRGDTDPAIVDILRGMLRDAVSSEQVTTYAKDTQASIVYSDADTFQSSVFEALKMANQYRDLLAG